MRMQFRAPLPVKVRPGAGSQCPARLSFQQDEASVDRPFHTLALVTLALVHPGPDRMEPTGGRLVEAGQFVLFALACRLLQEFLAAKRTRPRRVNCGSWTTSTSCYRTT